MRALLGRPRTQVFKRAGEHGALGMREWQSRRIVAIRYRQGCQVGGDALRSDPDHSRLSCKAKARTTSVRAQAVQDPSWSAGLTISLLSAGGGRYARRESTQGAWAVCQPQQGLRRDGGTGTEQCRSPRLAEKYPRGGSRAAPEALPHPVPWPWCLGSLSGGPSGRFIRAEDVRPPDSRFGTRSSRGPDDQFTR